MRKTFQTGALIAIVLLGLWGASAIAAPRSSSNAAAERIANGLIPARARKPAPDFTLTDVQGRTITLSQYKGKVVLLDFWAVACGGCKVEIPWYVNFDRKYHARGLTLIGIDMYGESVPVVKAFMAKAGMRYPVAIGTDALGTRFGVKEMPMTLLIDRDGRIAASHTGIVDKAAFESAIRRLLQ